MAGAHESRPPATGTIDAALDHAGQLLNGRPDLAEAQAHEILKAAPGDPRAVLLLGMAKRRQGDLDGARVVLKTLAAAQPRSAQTHCELGFVLASLGEDVAALAALRRAVGLKRDLPGAWRALGDLMSASGDPTGAEHAYAEHIRASVTDPLLMSAADALCDDRLAVAEHLLRDHLKAHPTDVAAMRMLAEAGTRLGRYVDAEALLTRCLSLTPAFIGARYNLALVLYRQQRGAEALPHLDELLAQDGADPSYRNLKAACLGLIGEYDQAITIYEDVLAQHAAQPQIWLSYGHALRTAGRQSEAVNAYGRALEMAPDLAETYWSLANLKTLPFTEAQEVVMRERLRQPDLPPDDCMHLHYALGKALEDKAEFADSFAHYSSGASLRHQALPYDAEETKAQSQRGQELFTPEFFAARTGQGNPAPDPIFIIGLPRSGSTLIEQILASHSAVEGTMELPDVAAMAREIGKPGLEVEWPRYPEALADLDAARLRTLGQDYLDRTRIHRKLGRPFFIDKMPNNLWHVGLIHLILPKAKIIDARRHPMAACFSAFKQHFARGQGFSYDLADLGGYYRDYVALMAHFDRVLPGRIHRVIYEDMVDDTEGEVRRLLDYCRLPFEANCLKFHENARAVRTASSEQVRRPIYREGLEQWRNYQPWLSPLAEALGPVLTDWR